MSNQRRKTGVPISGCFALPVVVLTLLSAPVQAGTHFSAQDFVQADIQTSLSILQDKTLSAEARHQRIHDFLLSLLDTKRIALYVLGSTSQNASSTDLDAFFAAFHDFLGAAYDSRLGTYDGQTLQITGTVEHGPGDFVVKTLLITSSDAPDAKPLEVDLRVIDEEGTFYIVDACVEGVWLTLALHDDLQGFLKEHNGDVAALTRHLKELTISLESAGT